MLEFYKGKTVLVTGHTGFKGSWLCEILINAGAKVVGYSLEPPTNPSLFELLKLDQRMISVIGDIRDFDHLNGVIKKYKPEIVFHLAAQPIVLIGYQKPAYTYHALIVESPEVKQQFPADFHPKIGVFPCLKHIFPVPNDAPYQHKDVLKLLFFSRVIKSKGVLEILDATIKANQTKVRFDLSIAGDITAEPETDALIQAAAEKYPFIHFLGPFFTIQGKESYIRFSSYDLHVFPSQFFHECAPGSVIDSFIAGVPTLSSKFHSYENLLNPTFAYFVEKPVSANLVTALFSIYEDQEALWNKRKMCQAEASKYSFDAFLAFFKSLLN